MSFLLNKMTKVQRDNFGNWMKALRSGGYKQGKDALVENPLDDRSEWNFCCLGVACDLVQSEHGDSLPLFQSTESLESFFEGDYPKEVTLEEYMASLDEDDLTDALRIDVPQSGDAFEQAFGLSGEIFSSVAQLNDARVPFAVIANLLSEAVRTNDPYAYMAGVSKTYSLTRAGLSSMHCATFDTPLDEGWLGKAIGGTGTWPGASEAPTPVVQVP